MSALKASLRYGTYTMKWPYYNHNHFSKDMKFLLLYLQKQLRRKSLNLEHFRLDSLIFTLLCICKNVKFPNVAVQFSKRPAIDFESKRMESRNEIKRARAKMAELF